MSGVKHPMGCGFFIIVFLCCVGIGAGIGFVLGKIMGSSDPDLLAVAGGVIGLTFFSISIDALHVFKIKRYCKSHGLQVIRVKIHKNHYGVELLENGKKSYRKWPVDFEEFEQKN